MSVPKVSRCLTGFDATETKCPRISQVIMHVCLLSLFASKTIFRHGCYFASKYPVMYAIREKTCEVWTTAFDWMNQVDAGLLTQRCCVKAYCKCCPYIVEGVYATFLVTVSDFQWMRLMQLTTYFKNCRRTCSCEWPSNTAAEEGDGRGQLLQVLSLRRSGFSRKRSMVRPYRCPCPLCVVQSTQATTLNIPGRFLRLYLCTGL